MRSAAHLASKRLFSNGLSRGNSPFKSQRHMFWRARLWHRWIGGVTHLTHANGEELISLNIMYIFVWKKPGVQFTVEYLHILCRLRISFFILN